MSKAKVAILGLGLMGGGMAAQLAAAGFPLTVYNRSRERAEPLAAKGAVVKGSPKEAVRDVDVIVSMVADDEASRNIWIGENGALAGMKSGAICIESSTVTVGWIRELGTAVNARGGVLLDAPVTGSKGAAAAGELRFLVGGDAKVLDRARSVFDAMGREIVHVGPAGSGALLKLINNFMCGVQLASLAQALAMIERAGLSRETALNLLSNGTPGSPMVKALTPRMETRNYEPNFLLRLMAKDMRYAIEEAAEVSVDLTTARSTLELLEEAMKKGLGEKDLSAVFELYRR